MLEFILGVAVVLFAGYFIARHRDRVRSIAAYTTLGMTAGSALKDTSGDGHPHHHGGDSHPSGPHWDSADSTGHSDSV